MDPLKHVTEHLDRVTGSEPARRARSLYEEFKAFAFKGNVVDLAVGVIIGAAFGKIVESLVKNVLMPVVGILQPAGQGYREWKVPLVNGQEIAVGLFLSDVLNFVLVALVLFLVIRKFLGWVLRVKEEAPPPPTREEELLAEIRDLLKTRVEAPTPGGPPGVVGGGTV